MTFLVANLINVLRVCLYVWGKSPEKSTVPNWERKFHFGREVLENYKRHSCMALAVTVKSIIVKATVADQNHRIIHEEIPNALGISPGSANNFLHDHVSV